MSAAPVLTNPPARAPKVSGAVVVNQLQTARQLAGEAVIERALTRLTSSQRDEVRGVLAVSWCSLATVRAFHEATAAEMGESVDVWHLRVVERSMQQTFNTVWRFFLRLTSPDALIKRAAAVYAKTYDTGSLEAVLIAPGHSRATLTGWPDVPDYQLNALATGISTMLRAAGRSSVTVRWGRIAQGARFEIHTRQ